MTAEEALKHEWITNFAADNEPFANTSQEVLDRMMSFKKPTRFQFEMIEILSHIINRKEQKELRETFESLDI